MWDNNNVQQLQFKGNSNTINNDKDYNCDGNVLTTTHNSVHNYNPRSNFDKEPKRAIIKGTFLSSGKLHNCKKENNFQILHHTTKSQRKKPYFLPNPSDNSIKNQTIEKQESILSQSV